MLIAYPPFPPLLHTHNSKDKDQSTLIVWIFPTDFFPKTGDAFSIQTKTQGPAVDENPSQAPLYPNP